MNIVDQLVQTLDLCPNCKEKARILVGPDRSVAHISGPREAALFLLVERIAAENNVTRHELKYDHKFEQARFEVVLEAKRTGFKRLEIGHILGISPPTVTNILIRHGANGDLRFPKPISLSGRHIRSVNCDLEEKRKRGYTDPRSVVHVDGSEELHGVDWRRRKRELRERSGDQCEHIDIAGEHADIGERCRNNARDPHHQCLRSRRRDDRIENLLHVCRACHIKLDPRKLNWSKP